jgi:hypothetical protein
MFTRTLGDLGSDSVTSIQPEEVYVRIEVFFKASLSIAFIHISVIGGWLASTMIPWGAGRGRRTLAGRSAGARCEAAEYTSLYQTLVHS